MKARGKRFFKRLFKIGKIPLLIGMGLLIGLAIGEDSHRADHSIVIANDGRFRDELSHNIEQRIEQQVRERVVEEIAIPPIPPIPDIPEIPDLPDFQTNVHIERTPSFWDVLNGIGTILASLMLIGLGGMILLRRWRQPKEKAPESAGA